MLPTLCKGGSVPSKNDASLFLISPPHRQRDERFDLIRCRRSQQRNLLRRSCCGRTCASHEDLPSPRLLLLLLLPLILLMAYTLDQPLFSARIVQRLAPPFHALSSRGGSFGIGAVFAEGSPMPCPPPLVQAVFVASSDRLRNVTTYNFTTGGHFRQCTSAPATGPGTTGPITNLHAAATLRVNLTTALLLAATSTNTTSGTAAGPVVVRPEHAVLLEDFAVSNGSLLLLAGIPVPEASSSSSSSSSSASSSWALLQRAPPLNITVLRAVFSKNAGLGIVGALPAGSIVAVRSCVFLVMAAPSPLMPLPLSAAVAAPLFIASVVRNTTAPAVVLMAASTVTIERCVITVAIPSGASTAAVQHAAGLYVYALDLRGAGASLAIRDNTINVTTSAAGTMASGIMAPENNYVVSYNVSDGTRIVGGVNGTLAGNATVSVVLPMEAVWALSGAGAVLSIERNVLHVVSPRTAYAFIFSGIIRTTSGERAMVVISSNLFEGRSAAATGPASSDVLVVRGPTLLDGPYSGLALDGNTIRDNGTARANILFSGGATVRRGSLLALRRNRLISGDQPAIRFDGTVRVVRREGGLLALTGNHLHTNSQNVLASITFNTLAVDECVVGGAPASGTPAGPDDGGGRPPPTDATTTAAAPVTAVPAPALYTPADVAVLLQGTTITEVSSAAPSMDFLGTLMVATTVCVSSVSNSSSSGTTRVVGAVVARPVAVCGTFMYTLGPIRTPTVFSDSLVPQLRMRDCTATAAATASNTLTKTQPSPSAASRTASRTVRRTRTATPPPTVSSTAPVTRSGAGVTRTPALPVTPSLHPPRTATVPVPVDPPTTTTAPTTPAIVTTTTISNETNATGVATPPPTTQLKRTPTPTSGRTSSRSARLAPTVTRTMPVIVPPRPVETPSPGLSGGVSTAAAVLAGGAPVALDLQTAAALGAAACTSSGRSRRSAYKALSPVTLYDTCDGVLLGNTALVLGAASLAAMAVSALIIVGRRTPIQSLATLRMPSLLLALTVFLLNSHLVCAIEYIREGIGRGDDSTTTASSGGDDDGALALQGSAAVLVGVLIILVAAVTAASYPLIAFLFGTRRYAGVVRAWPQPWQALSYVCLPRGEFQANAPLRMFGGVIGAWRRPGVGWPLVPFITIAAILPCIAASGAACLPAYTAAAAVHFAAAVFVVVVRPRRVLLADLLHALALASNGGIVAAFALRIEDPSHAGAAAAIERLAWLQLALTIVRVLQIASAQILSSLAYAPREHRPPARIGGVRHDGTGWQHRARWWPFPPDELLQFRGSAAFVTLGLLDAFLSWDSTEAADINKDDNKGKKIDTDPDSAMRDRGGDRASTAGEESDSSARRGSSATEPSARAAKNAPRQVAEGLLQVPAPLLSSPPLLPSPPPTLTQQHQQRRQKSTASTISHSNSNNSNQEPRHRMDTAPSFLLSPPPAGMVSCGALSSEEEMLSLSD